MVDKFELCAQSALLKATYVLNALVCVAGIVLDIWLIVATARNKFLRSSSCAVLIAFYSGACVFGFLDAFLPLFFAFAYPRVAYPRTLQCALLQLVPFSLSNLLFPTMFAIALDRLLSVVAPLWLAGRDQNKYLFAHCSLTVLYPLFVAGAILKNGLDSSTDTSATFCRMGEALGPSASYMVSAINLGFIWASVGSYIFIWIRLRRTLAKGGALQQQGNWNHPMFKSLFIIVSLQAFGWTSGLVGYAFVLLSYTDATVVQNSVFFNLVNSFVCLCGAVDVPVLYLTSTEHRRALRKELRSLFGILPEPAPTNVVFVKPSPSNNNNNIASRINSSRP